ncbi:polysaccharide lyase family 8 super-sandwich domain-containing protein [Microbacterium sp. KSW4-11]|uniref:Polysaccharide lyase family 8 super-sandwich domain-containing protein n=1 Tax=Microbacterium gawkjiense TaxID=3067309 RepID=A0ABU3GE47_9MICO|nr:polysaccharide lyase family 8 super-sandwich domain-containing protein [Microbacterium sp. KSW4-11]MDT3318083.1 polysaccharide lyase family 8 super-sandwich domain-containing protein [Microbacterium sp. KSW4-11]
MRSFTSKSTWRGAILSLSVVISVSLLAGPPAVASEQDEFSAVREKWVASIVGDGNLDLADPDVAAKVASVTQLAETRRSRVDRSAVRTSVFTDLTTRMPNQNITNSFIGLREMAVAYRTDGSALEGDVGLRDDIIGGLVWLEANWYNAEVPFAPQSPDNNWFAWELGAPLALVDVLALMHDDLPSGLLDDYVAAIDHFLPRPDQLGHSVNWTLGSEGANLAWAVTVLGKRGILGEDGDVVAEATTALSPLFDYAADGANGFHRDGSVLFHEGFPYTTGYGWSNVIEPTLAVMLYEGSPWEITDPDKANLVSWARDSFEPFLFGNRIHDSLAGRNIARPRSQDRASGLVNLALDLRSIGSPAESAHLDSLVKHLLRSDPQSSFWKNGSIPNIVEARRLLNDPTVPELEPGDFYKQFPAMDRSVARRDGWSFGVAMHSSRTQNYESINNENVRGWHTADGRTTLFTSDIDQYGEDYWPTIDATRIPGTTVVQHEEDDVLAPQVGRLEIMGSKPVIDDLSDFSRVHYRSPRWTVDKNPEAANGDTSRVRRTENSQEQLTWTSAAAATSFAIEVHHTSQSGLDRVTVLASTNDSTYSPVKVTPTVVAQAGGWTTSVLRPTGALPTNTRFIRIQLAPSVPQSSGDSVWAGGTSLEGKYGASGMELIQPESGLSARKSWFVLDDEIVAVGSDISGTKDREVETVVENRRLTRDFPGNLTVDGENLGAADGDQRLADVSWANLGGGVDGSDLGYVFPSTTDLRAVRETRSANWSEIGNSTLAASNRFASLILEHGAKPTDGTYSYVLLPGADAGQTAAYAENPDIEVLAQAPEAHAVRAADQGIVGATTWTKASTTINVNEDPFMTVTGRAAVMTQESNGEMRLAISDPTQGADKAGPVDDSANGFSQIFERSTNWGLEPGGGFKRTTATQEYLTYRVDQAQDFLVTLRWNHQLSGSNTSPILDRVRFSTSPDNKTWSPVKVQLTKPHTPTDGGGLTNTADVEPIGDLPADTQYVRIEALDTDPKIWSPQIRRVQIESGAPEGAFVDVEIARTALATLEQDPRVEVVSLNPLKIRVDVADAHGETFHARFAYDVKAPELTVTAPEAVWTDRDSTMQVVAADDGGDTAITVIADGTEIPVPTTGTLPLDTSYGNHEYLVTATDRAGNTTKQTVRYRSLRFLADPPTKDTVKAGATLPVRFGIEAPGRAGEVTAVLKASDVEGNTLFRKAGQHYQALWRSKKEMTGEHSLIIHVTVDGVNLPAREHVVLVRNR